MTALLHLPFLVGPILPNAPGPPTAPDCRNCGCCVLLPQRPAHGSSRRPVLLAGLRVRLSNVHRMRPLITNSSSGNSSRDKKYKDTLGSSPLIEFSLLLLL